MASRMSPCSRNDWANAAARSCGVLLVGDERLVVAEGDGGGDDAQVVDEPQSVLVGAGDGEGDDAAEAAGELGGGGGVLRRRSAGPG